MLFIISFFQITIFLKNYFIYPVSSINLLALQQYSPLSEGQQKVSSSEDKNVEHVPPITLQLIPPPGKKNN